MHDLLEDTKIDPEIIDKNFNNKTFTLVNNLTRLRDEDETEQDKKINKPIHLKKILASDSQTIFIKSADMIDNINSWPHIKSDNELYFKFPRWFKEAKEFYLPMISKYSETEAELVEKVIKEVRIEYDNLNTRI